MLDVSRIYWSLRALGREADAARLRSDWTAARSGDPAAARRLEATAEELKDALVAAARAHPAKTSARAAETGGHAPADAAALRARLVAAERADEARRARRRWLRRLRAAVAVAVLLVGGVVAAALAIRHRDDVTAGWAKAREQVAAALARAGAWVGRWGGPSSAPAARAERPAPARALSPVPRTRARAKTATPGAATADGTAVAGPVTGTGGVLGDAPPAPAAGPGPVRAAGEPPSRGGLGALASLWRPQTWDLTVDDVVRTIPGAVRVDGAAPDADGLAAGAIARPVSAAGESWIARFRFDGAGRLSEIQLFPADPGGATRRARERLAAALGAEHGAPRAEGSGASARVLWGTAAGTAELLGDDADPGPPRVLFLDLAAGELRPVPEPLATLTLRAPPAADRSSAP